MIVAGFALPASADYCYGACDNYPYQYPYSYNYPYNNYYNYNNPPSCTITLSQSPTSYSQSWISQYGYPMLLTWSSSNATTASISPDVGSVSPSGSRIVYTRGQIYSMSVYGNGGTATCQTSSFAPTYPYSYPYNNAYSYNYGSYYQPYYSNYTYPTYTYPTYNYPTYTTGVKLSQMPYTGADFGFAGTLATWLAIVLVAGAGAVMLAQKTRLAQKVASFIAR